MRAIVAKEDADETVRIKVWDEKSMSLGEKKLSEWGNLDSWAEIFTRTGLKNQPGQGLLSLVDEHMVEVEKDMTIENVREQTTAIMQKAVNIVGGYMSSKYMSLINGSIDFFSKIYISAHSDLNSGIFFRKSLPNIFFCPN